MSEYREGKRRIKRSKNDLKERFINSACGFLEIAGLIYLLFVIVLSIIE